MIHVVIPAAGDGKRFAEAGYRDPKPLVDVLGRPMIQRVIDNLKPALAGREHRVTVLSRVPLPGIDADVQIIGPTRGAVETILQADLDGQLLIANCDQLVTSDWLPPLARDGWLLTFPSVKPHHSYVRTDGSGIVKDIAEKQVISRLAIAGVYAFEDGAAFRGAAETVLREDRRVLGEFYVSTVIAELLAGGAEFGTVDCRCAILGTPEELQLFEAAAEVARTL